MKDMYELSDSELEKVVGGSGEQGIPFIAVCNKCGATVRPFNMQPEELEYMQDEGRENCQNCGGLQYVHYERVN